MRMQQILPAAALVLVAPLQAQSNHPALHVDPTLKSCSIMFAPNLTQGAFRRFIREAGSATSYRQLSSATTLAKGKVSVGIEMLSFTEDEWSPAWNDTFYHPHAEHPLGSRQSFPELKLRVGVADDADVGAFYAANPEANYGWLGVDAKYRVATQSDGMPVSVAVRGAYTKTLYVHDLKMQSLTADISADRTVWRTFRPYVGVGADALFARSNSDSVSLHRENALVPHVFGGFDVMLLKRVSLGLEFTMGAVPSAQTQLSFIAF